MSNHAQSHGDIPTFISNDDEIYEGNLEHYLCAVFYCAKNLNLPYHNFRHMLHVTWLCYEACIFYRDALTPRQMRNLLIAALFHDYDHRGGYGNDGANIERAIIGIRRHILPMDRDHLPTIEALIRTTQYPHVVPVNTLDLSGQILGDADMAQAFSVAWVQQVVFGLAAEWGNPPIGVLKAQGPFLKELMFHTTWAQARFPQSDIRAKREEAARLYDILELGAPEAA